MESRYHFIRNEPEYHQFLNIINIEDLSNSLKVARLNKFTTFFQLSILSEKDDAIFQKPVIYLSFKTADILGKLIDNYKLKIHSLTSDLNYASTTTDLIDLFFHVRPLIKLNEHECKAATQLFQKIYYYLSASYIDEIENIKDLFLNLYMLFYKACRYNLYVVGTYQVCARQFNQKWTLL